MTWANYDDVVDQLQAGGLLIDGGIEVNTSRPMRCHVDGGDREKRGWYWLHDIDLPDASGQRQCYIVGAFGIYHGNDNGKQTIKLKRDGAPALTQAEKDAIRARHEANMKRAKAIRLQEARKAADQAYRAWRKYVPEGESDYLKRKGVAAHGLRFDPSGHGTVAVPMLRDGRIVGLQIIRGKNRGNKLEKQYWPSGMDKIGAYHLIGGTPRGLVLVAEGYATAASLHEATGLPVAVAFDAGSVLPVSVSLHKQYRCKVLICADDDYLTPGNPGEEAARTASAAVGGAWILPKFAEDRSTTKKGPTDFNDLHALEGLHVVREQVESRLRELKWSVPQAREPLPKGGGEKAKSVNGNSAQSIMHIDDLVERFIPIDDGTGDHVWDSWTSRIVKQKQMTALLPAKVRGDDIKQHSLWQTRGAYFLDQIGFDPMGKNPRIQCNMWTGWPTVPKEGGCERLLELLRYQCSGEPGIASELYQWVLRWLAYLIQNPGAKMQTAIIIHGPQGTGKGLFFEWGYMPIFGRYAVYLDQDAIEDKHGSDWQSAKLFVLADEMLARAEMYHHKNKLKNLVTSRRIRINPKGLVAYEEDNHLNIVFLSNEKQPLVLENDDRRYCVIWTPPPLSRDFYDELSQEIANGGVEALHHYLLNEVDLGDFKPWTRPPMTQAKRDLINLGRDSVDRFMIDWKGGDTNYPFCPCSSSDLYRAYLQWCRVNGERLPRPENQFSGYIVKLAGWIKGHKDVHMEDESGLTRPRRQRVVIPSAADMNDAAKAGRSFDYRKKPEQNETEWITICFFTFRRAVSAEQ